jgi:hypothetical protein
VCGVRRGQRAEYRKPERAPEQARMAINGHLSRSRAWS